MKKVAPKITRTITGTASCQRPTVRSSMLSPLLFWLGSTKTWCYCVPMYSGGLGLRPDVSGQSRSQSQYQNRASYANGPCHDARLDPQCTDRVGSDGAQGPRAILPQRHWRRTPRPGGHEYGGPYGAQ